MNEGVMFFIPIILGLVLFFPILWPFYLFGGLFWLIPKLFP